MSFIEGVVLLGVMVPKKTTLLQLIMEIIIEDKEKLFQRLIYFSVTESSLVNTLVSENNKAEHKATCLVS